MVRKQKFQTAFRERDPVRGVVHKQTSVDDKIAHLLLKKFADLQPCTCTFSKEREKAGTVYIGSSISTFEMLDERLVGTYSAASLPSFWDGLASVLDIGAGAGDPSWLVTDPRRSDTEALAGDWYVIASDLHRAMDLLVKRAASRDSTTPAPSEFSARSRRSPEEDRR
jgi:hypothetical protein